MVAYSILYEVLSTGLLDAKLHSGQITVADAVHQAPEIFQDAKIAYKWVEQRLLEQPTARSCYGLGLAQILALREQVKQQQGKRFDLKAFHRKFLSYGFLPIASVSKLAFNQTLRPIQSISNAEIKGYYSSANP